MSCCRGVYQDIGFRSKTCTVCFALFILVRIHPKTSKYSIRLDFTYFAFVLYHYGCYSVEKAVYLTNNSCIERHIAPNYNGRA